MTDMEDTQPAPRQSNDYLLVVVLLAAGLAAMCLVFIAAVGGPLLSDWYHARGIIWGLPDRYLGYTFLAGFVGTLSGLMLTSIGKVKVSRRVILLPALSGFVFVASFPALFSAKQPSPQSWCTSNQRQLATAFNLYAQDHDGRLPQQWSDIDVYLGGSVAELTTCPQSKRAFHPHLGYGLNSFLVGKNLDDFQHPSELLVTADSVRPGMLISSMADIDVKRHYNKSRPQGFVMSFLDGHAKFIYTADEVRLTEREGATK